MALKSTIHKAVIHLADMDRNLYQTLNLTLAQHPSETAQRLMTRLLAFILNSSPQLTFGKGISDEEEAALWQIDYDGSIDLWIALGHPDEKRMKKACNKAKKTKLYCYQTSSEVWWREANAKFSAFTNLTVEQFSPQLIDQLANWLSRNMEFQCSIEDEQMWLTNNEQTLLIERKTLQ